MILFPTPSPLQVLHLSASGTFFNELRCFVSDEHKEKVAPIPDCSEPRKNVGREGDDDDDDDANLGEAGPSKRKQQKQSIGRGSRGKGTSRGKGKGKAID